MTEAIRELSAAEIIAEENALIDFQFAIIDALNERNLTQAEFASMLGVSRARVSQMLSSRANPTIKLVGRALSVLGLSANYLSVAGLSSADENNDHDLDSAIHTTERTEAFWHYDISEQKKDASDKKRSSSEGIRKWSASAQQSSYRHDWRSNRRAGANSNGKDELAAA